MPNYRRLLICISKIWFLFLFLGSCKTYAQNQSTYPDSVEEKIKNIENNICGWVEVEGIKSSWSLPERMKYYRINGLSIAVIHNYKLEWAKGYGWADSAHQIPVTTATLFQAASVSKSLNAVGVLKLAQESKLNIHDNVDRYLKSWHLPANRLAGTKKVTLYNLLNHTAGLNIHGFPGYETGAKLPSIIQILNGEKPANSEAVKFVSEPGIQVEYSGGGVEISQLIVMDVTHKPYAKYQWDEVLKPLGMTNSFFTQPPPENKKALLAVGYGRDGKEINKKFHIYPELAAAGLWTTPTDLAKFIIEVQLALEGKSHKVLSRLFVKQMLSTFKNSDAGLGVFVDTIGARLYFKHSGANEGFRCQYFGSLKDGDGVVVMVNSDQDAILHDIIPGISHEYNWEDFYKPQKKTVVHVLDVVLQRYTGTYILNGETMSVVKNNGNLQLSLNSNAPMQIYFTSNKDFFVMEIQFNSIRFEPGSKNNNYDIVLKSGDSDIRFIKK